MPTVDPLSLDLATLAVLTGDAATAHLLQRIRDAGHPGIRVSHGYIIQRLVDAEPTVGELGEALGVTQQAASKSINELEDLGYVERRTDGVDSRVRRVTLTAKGLDVLAVGRRARAELEAALPGRDLIAAKRALADLLHRVGGLEAVRGRRAPLRREE